MYSIQTLAKIAQVSSRTLRYYDQIQLLKPALRSKAGLRLYDTPQVDQLQRILFFKTLDIPLKEIKSIMQEPIEVQIQQLKQHQHRLQIEQERLNGINQAITSAIKMMKGNITMTDSEKFDAFKAKKIIKNEAKYGMEIRHKYGNETVDKANQQYLNLTENQLSEVQKLEQTLGLKLKVVLESTNLKIESEIFKLHQQWLKIMVGDLYSTIYHQNLALMYQKDERFSKYYDQLSGQSGSGIKLGDIILEQLG